MTVLVGKDKKEYLLHRCFAPKTSEFFEKALSGNWKESEDKTIKIHDFEPDVFDDYLQWVYTSVVPIETGSILESSESGKLAEIRKRRNQLTDLYVLGYFLLDTSLRNTIVDAIIQVSSREAVCARSELFV